MKKLKLLVRSEGSVCCLYNELIDFTKFSSGARVTRISRVEADDPDDRDGFPKFSAEVFLPDGSTAVLLGFNKRSEAIAAEMEFIQGRLSDFAQSNA